MPANFPSRAVRVFLIAVALCGLTIFIYRPAWNGQFIWDDDRYVTSNSLLTAKDGLQRIWFSPDAPSQYFPLTYTLLRIERSFWDLNPSGYHWVNILMHAANALLLWKILTRLRIPGALLAAAIFSLHPIQVESVAWISELKNVLMGFFFLLALLIWTEYVDLSAADQRRRLFYVSALACFALALFAKSTACTLPAALLLILWFKKQPISRRALIEIVPFVVLALGSGLLAMWWEKYHQGTRVLPSLGLLERILIATRAPWFYLSKIFWPSNLTFIYPRWKIDPADPTAYLGLIALVVVILAIYFARRLLGRGPEVAALFFVATLSPVIGFIMLYTFRYTFVADHYQYLACIGPIALFCAGATFLIRRLKNSNLAIAICSALILGGLSLLTWRQSGSYRDIETLWRTTIEKNPSCWMAYNNLGAVEVGKGNIESAIAKYEKALALQPAYPEAHYNLGAALLQQGKIDQAISHSEEAIKLQPSDPDAHVVLGNAFMAKQDIDQAIDQYEQALSVRPDDYNAHFNLGSALQQKGKTERAAREFARAHELEPFDHQ
jgi:tetratricopeptide (TPR) repeat protein